MTFVEFDIQWWVYILMAITVFLVCLLLNYVINKINESRLEERLIALSNKTSANQTTQVQSTLMEMEAGKKLISEEKNTPRSISIVIGNRYKNKKDEIASNISNKTNGNITLTMNDSTALKQKSKDDKDEEIDIQPMGVNKDSFKECSEGSSTPMSYEMENVATSSNRTRGELNMKKEKTKDGESVDINTCLKPFAIIESDDNSDNIPHSKKPKKDR